MIITYRNKIMKTILPKEISYLIAITLYLFSVNCQGPLEGERIKFLTPSVFKDLDPTATRIVMKTENSNWIYENVQYNDTIAEISTGKIYKVENGKVIDPSFSYNTKTVNKKWITEIKGSFFTITSESTRDKNEPTVITVDITENTSKEKRVLIVQLLSLDSGSFFKIEQNHK